jgi:hypothetical protein
MKEGFKEFLMEHFSKFSYQKGDMIARGEICDAYDELYDERPTVQYMREADGDLDKYCEVLLECLRKGKEYRMSEGDASDYKRVDEDEWPHDGWC